MNQQTIIFIGRSGSGKGTQADLLIDYIKKNDQEKREVFYIESGDLFRDFFSRTGYTAEISKDLYDNGGLQPEFLAVWMWSNELINKLKKDQHLILDGTPRKYHEAHILDSALRFYDRHGAIIFNIDISREEATKRLLARGRGDDEVKNIERRLSWFETDVVPAMEHLRNSNTFHFYDVNGERSVEEIHQDVVKLMLNDPNTR